MRYIDSDKLIAEIERRLKMVEPHKDTFESAAACRQELIWMKEFIASLQQEQPMPDSTKLIELWHEDKEMLKEKDFRDDPWRLAYNAFMCGFGRGISVKRHEQPEVGLEKFDKDVTEIWGRCAADPNDSIACLHIETFSEIARHFYELGLNARKI